MIRLKVTICCVVLAALSIAFTQNALALQGTKQMTPGYIPHEGFLPDVETAISVAEIILARIYGAENIKRQSPLVGKLSDDVWVIRGSLASAQGQYVVGGVAEIHLKKSNGAVLKVTHSR